MGRRVFAYDAEAGHTDVVQKGDISNYQVFMLALSENYLLGSR